MKNPPSAELAKISEIFSSLQGEGPCLGQRHIFIRFEECHIHCGYCDELDKPGTTLSIDEVMNRVLELEKESGPHSYISLTGGEPLLYLQFIKPLIQQLKEKKFKIYLETNGILWKALEAIICDCDMIAMDMKPPSVTEEKNFDLEHKKFLEIAKQKPMFVKFVLSKEINAEEFLAEMKIIEDEAPNVPVILQPISTKIEGHEDADLMELLENLQKLALHFVKDVRIVPRFHRIFNLR